MSEPQDKRPAGWVLESAMSVLEWAVAVILLFLTAWGVAALVAVARKVLIIEPGMDAQQLLFKSLGLAALMLSIGIVWYLLRRSGVGFEEKEADYLLPRLFGRKRPSDERPAVEETA